MCGLQLLALETLFQRRSLVSDENCGHARLHLVKMGRDHHEHVGDGDEENVGEETELLSTTSLEGLDFDRLRLNPGGNLHIPLFRLLEERLGEFGPYQRKLYILVCLPAALTATITMARYCLQNL